MHQNDVLECRCFNNWKTESFINKGIDGDFKSLESIVILAFLQ